MKTYTIAGKEFTLKDLTLDEADEVNKLITTVNGGAEISNKNSKRFLQIVLAPVEDGTSVDFGKCTETVALEVMKDFFSAKIASGESLKNFFTSLIAKRQLS